MPDRIGADGGIEEAKGLRGASAAGAERDYYKMLNTKPRRNAFRAAALGWDTLELRAAGVDGSILERIVYKRLSTIWGPPGIGFIYKYALGGAPGVRDPRAFAGGVEMDFIILSRPSGRQMALEVQGAHWHGPTEQYADMDRALSVLASGRDYAEIWEYEVLLGDDFLDNRLLQLIGAQGAVARRGHPLDEERTIRSFYRELGAPET